MRWPWLLLWLGMWGMPLGGATNHSGLEYPPLEVGSTAWQKIQKDTKDRQALYQKRISIPDAVGDDVPRAKIANFADLQKPIPAQTPAPAAASGALLNWLFFAVALIAGAVLIVRKFTPQIFVTRNQQFNPGWPAPATENNPPEKVRAEEEAFAGFLAAFRVGPAVAPGIAAPERNPIKEFHARAEKHLGSQRKLLQEISREASDAARQKSLARLLVEMTALKGEAEMPEALPVWQVTAALEGLLKHLTEKMRHFTPSTLRSVVGGLDLLDNLCASQMKPGSLTDHPLKFLVVDDDMISRQALSLALNKTFSQPDLAEDGETALAKASQHAYDVIFLDVQMPGMDGFELCKQIRDTGPNRNTPVVFVTGQSEFDARIKSVLSGGNDLMGKPFLTFEVTVKALTLALQGRLHGQKSLQKSDPTQDQPAAPEMVADDSLRAANPTRDPQSLMGAGTAAAEPVKFTYTALTRRAKQLRPPATRTPVAEAATAADNFSAAFLSRAATQLGPLRDLCQKLLQTPEEAARQAMVVDGFLRVNALTSNTDATIAHPAHQMCAALEGLLRKLMENPNNTTTSTLATFASAVDLLHDLCAPGLKADLASHPPIQMLVVDDDLVSRRALVGALQTTFKKPEGAGSGEAALMLAAEKPYDVIFMDVVMPGMDGFETCSKIRGTAINRTTPVVFVTGKSDDNAHAQITRSGGNDLLTKPFLTSEITVKALTYALRGRLG